jgi:hypothetical protein
MKELTEKQIEFLLEEFFSTGDSVGPSVGRILLTEGMCTVPGNGHIWHGGVGNHITICPAPKAVGCSLLRLDLPAFLISPWVRERIKARIDELEDLLADTLLAVSEMRALHQ